jgi:hypothetical protein
MVVYAIALLVVTLSAAMQEFGRFAALDADLGYLIAALLFIIVLFELGRGAP